jgi:Flp pilus assembly protein TadG
MKYESLIRRFSLDEDGTTSIEFLMWVPVMVMFLTMTTDATLLMHQQQNLYTAARDASRQVALGQKTDDEAQEELIERLGIDTLTAEVAIENGFVITTISVPFKEVTHISGLFVDGNLSADVSMWIENAES